MVRYLSAGDIYSINEEVTGERPRIRERHLLRSAARRPTLHMFGEEQFPTVLEKAAALLHSLAYHHLFADGNKRTARRAVVFFLNANGYDVTWEPDEAFEFILSIAKGQRDVPEIAHWLEANTTPLT